MRPKNRSRYNWLTHTAREARELLRADHDITPRERKRGRLVQVAIPEIPTPLCAMEFFSGIYA